LFNIIYYGKGDQKQILISYISKVCGGHNQFADKAKDSGESQCGTSDVEYSNEPEVLDEEAVDLDEEAMDGGVLQLVKGGIGQRVQSLLYIRIYISRTLSK